jgi:hypothetical protein
MEWILFTIGLFLGSIGSVVAISIVTAGKMSDLDSEILSLRIQRNLLKEQLLMVKKKKPYKKRKYYNKNKK